MTKRYTPRQSPDKSEWRVWDRDKEHWVRDMGAGCPVVYGSQSSAQKSATRMNKHNDEMSSRRWVYPANKEAWVSEGGDPRD